MSYDSNMITFIPVTGAMIINKNCLNIGIICIYCTLRETLL